MTSNAEFGERNKSKTDYSVVIVLNRRKRHKLSILLLSVSQQPIIWFVSKRTRIQYCLSSFIVWVASFSLNGVIVCIKCNGTLTL